MRRAAAAGGLAAVVFEAFKQVASVYLKVMMHGPAPQFGRSGVRPDGVRLRHRPIGAVLHRLGGDAG